MESPDDDVEFKSVTWWLEIKYHEIREKLDNV